MDYKDIYEELDTVLMGDEYTEAPKEEGEIGVGKGYLFSLHDIFGDRSSKIDRFYHDRTLRIFKKFVDKLYLETKDEYVIKLIQRACEFTAEVYDKVDLSDVYGTKDDPAYMFDYFKKEEAIEPKPEDKYTLILRDIKSDGSSEYEVKNYKYYEEAKKEYDKRVAEVKIYATENYGSMEKYNLAVHDDSDFEDNVDEDCHFKINNCEYLLKKRDK